MKFVKYSHLFSKIMRPHTWYMQMYQMLYSISRKCVSHEKEPRNYSHRVLFNCLLLFAFITSKLFTINRQRGKKRYSLLHISATIGCMTFQITQTFSVYRARRTDTTEKYHSVFVYLHLLNNICRHKYDFSHTIFQVGGSIERTRELCVSQYSKTSSNHSVTGMELNILLWHIETYIDCVHITEIPHRITWQTKSLRIRNWLAAHE